MFKRNMIIVCAMLCLLLIAAIAHAQLPQISSGLSYLTTSQNPDGTWNTSTQVETTEATVSVLESLKTLNQTAGTPYTTGISWLQNQSPTSVDYQAQRIHALGLTDTSINALIPQLDQLKHAWGGDDGYETDNLDTASALQTLNSANYPDLSVVNTALAYLTNTQNTDGGWGFNQGDESNIFMTATVSSTLLQFSQTTTIAAAITKSTAYLVSRQNIDGGFGITTSGASSSTIHETALAYDALIRTGNGQATAQQNAITYLTSKQSMDGSWDEDPYSTALAIKALYYSENKPAPPPAVATTGSIMATVVDSTTNAPLAGGK